MYWTDGSEQVVCGCFRGTLDELESEVRKTHSGTQQETDYLQFINAVRRYKNDTIGAKC